MGRDLMINKERLLHTINVSASIGTTENGGLSRLALSTEDKMMRDVFMGWLKDEGLEVRVDDFGNIYGRREGKLQDAPSVAIGSHLDTQPCGGKYDGILGVLASLEVIRVLNENNIETDYPIEVVNFTNEEGARFSPALLGSGGATNLFERDFVYNTKDDNGVLFIDALREIGYEGKEEHRIKNVKNYVELHIEQGPILDIEDKSIGVVEGIQGMDWLHVTVKGDTNHAGPTPMGSRKDALVAASKMVVRVNDITKSHEGLKTTVGKFEVKPNVTNVIPGEVVFSIDIRHESDEKKQQAWKELERDLQRIAKENDVAVEVQEEWSAEAVRFSDEVRDAISEAADAYEYSSMRLYSGPGHDSKYMNEVAQSGMIFVKSIGGISHNEAELTLDEDLVKGNNVLLHVVQKLATKDSSQ